MKLKLKLLSALMLLMVPGTLLTACLQPKTTPRINIAFDWSGINPDEKTDSFRWTELFMERMIDKSILSMEDLAYPYETISCGEFLHWLCRYLPDPHEMILDDPENDLYPNHPYQSDILKAYKLGILAKEESFFSEQALLRSIAALWLIRAKGGATLEAEAQSIPFPAIPAQDGFDEILGPYSGALTLAFRPDHQLLHYRWKKGNDFRWIDAKQPLIKAEAAASLYHLFFPPKRGGSMVIAQTHKIPLLFPGIIDTANSSHLLQLLYQNVIGGIDQQGSHYPMLIRKIPTQENGLWKLNDDGSMELTFQLRPGILWSDGIPMTSQDAIFAFQLKRSPVFPVKLSEVESWIEKIDLVDSHTLKVFWNKPYHLANQILALFPSHREDHIMNYLSVEVIAGSQNDKIINDSDFMLVHAGPYIIHAQYSSEFMELKANPHYLFGEPLIERIGIKVLPNSDSLADAVISGKADLVLSGLGSKALRKIEAHPQAFHALHQVLSLHWEHIDLCTDHPFLSEPEVRQALLYSIDREKLHNDLSDELHLVSHSWFPPSHPSYNETQLHQYPYSPVKAEQLMEAAAWKKNPQTHQWEKNGQVFELTFLSTSTNQARKQMQDDIAQYWQDLGIIVRTVQLDPKELFENILVKRNFTEATAILYRWEFTPYSTFYPILHSSMVPTQHNNYQGQNYTAFQHSLVDKILLDTFRHMDSTQINLLLGSLQEILSRELPSLPLYHPIAIMSVHQNITGFFPARYNESPFWNILNWYWDF